MQHEHNSQLLDRALLRLSPDVFFHPVWTHFVEARVPLSPEQIQSLLDAGDELLSAGNLVEACQTLFICAFQQLRAGDYAAASSSIQRILVLAEQHGLPQVAWWATWGAAAVCALRGWFQQAAEHLEHLQSMLNQQHEWVLSDVIDVLRQTLLSRTQAEVTAADRPLSSDAILSSAFEQLLQWGTPRAASGINYDDAVGGGHPGRPATAPSGPAGFTWRSLWQRIRRVVKGDLRLQWVESEEPAQVSYADQNRSPVLHPPLPAALVKSPTAPEDVEVAEEPAVSQDATMRVPDTDRSESAAGPTTLPSITAHLLGTFSCLVNDATVQSWPTGKGRAVFKYLLTHHDQPIPRDVLMDVFWPQAGPEAARNSLNVALHGLRQALKTVTDIPVILFEEGAYGINPEFHVRIDVDEFDRHVQAGRRLEANGQIAKAAAKYEAAIGLYQGDFLADDPYEEWPMLPRERLRVAYLDVLDHLSQIHFNRGQYADCVALCQILLTRDRCREDIHCLLMRCYSREGQRHLALRQYQICVEALRVELEVDPVPETVRLYEQIRRHERV